MKQKKTVFVVILLLALLLGGASVLYPRLAQKAGPQQLPNLQAQSDTKPQTDPEDDGQSAQTEAAEDPAPESIKAPDFVVYNAQGDAVRLSEYFGKPIVLNFWASWCGPCQSEMPDFHEKYLEQGDSVQFLMINMTDGSRETVKTASAYLEKNGYTFPVLYDTSANAALTYGAFSVPMTFFIDAQGNVITWVSGPIDANLLQRGMDMIR